MYNTMRWLIFFGEDWGRHSSTGQYLAKELSNDFQILWVNSLGLRQPKLNISDLKRIAIKMSDFFFLRKKENKPQNIKNIVVMAPLVIPFWQYRIIRKFNRTILKRQMISKIKQYAISQPILITSCPSTVDIVGDLDRKKIVYYCADDYSQMPGMNKSLINNFEEELLLKTDILIVTSKKLNEKFKGKIKDIQYLPHGVDYLLFKKALKIQERDKPDDLKKFTGKIIGFVGLISEHIDLDLIEKIAKAHSNINIVLIGREENNVDRHIQLRNVHYLGEKKREELPYYLAYFDLCLIPYKNTRRVRYANPTKFKEYIAAGCPVVTYKHLEIDESINGVSCANDEEEYLFKIDEVLMHLEKIEHKRISEEMMAETWRHKSKIMLKMIE